MPSVFTLEGPQLIGLPQLEGESSTWARIPTWAKWLMFAGGAAGVYWAAGKGVRLLQSSSWGDQRYAQSRERSFHGLKSR